ncbi:Phox-associated domain [Forsythia ovata]|uniref:Phox-associated domain n=1 Tax=Forsythia ovata TaxID=205694 RepID=A0ABD1PXM5_9LAMI
MKKAMESLQDLIEEAKLRTVWWALCIFAVSYFLTHTSKSMLMNAPIAVLLVSGLRMLFNEVEFRWKVPNARPQSYLSHLEKKQLSANDSRLTTRPPPPKWKRKIDSPVVEAAMQDFIDKLLRDFVIDLWYSDITPDKEAPELIRAVIMDALGEVSGRVKEVNIVDLLTRDVVDLIGDHLDLFRKNQASIGVDVMGTLSSEERDERLKHHLLASKQLHPALISPECEYKFLQQLMGGLLTIVLRPREAQCPLVRCIARELVTCLVLQPLINLVSPGYVNELVEYILLAIKDELFKDVGADQSSNMEGHDHAAGESALRKNLSVDSQGTDMTLARFDNKKELMFDASGNPLSDTMQDERAHPRPADWARVFEAATQRRTEVLMPENLENMWAIGRNYKKKLKKSTATGLQDPEAAGSVSSVMPQKQLGIEVWKNKPETSNGMEDKALMQLLPMPRPDAGLSDHGIDALHMHHDLNKEEFSKEGSTDDKLEDKTAVVPLENRNRLKRSNSTSDLKVKPNTEDTFTRKGGSSIISEFYSADVNGSNIHIHGVKSASDIVLHSEGLHVPKLRCRVIGAYFEKLGSTSFAVYSIAVTDADNNTWFVKRRYRNFERLHRHLKDIPNYMLHLPPKRIFSSSTEDAFVHQRCIQLDKYLQDLLSIANVAEQHEVWDFLSASSKNYSFGKSSSVMKTLAVNVDDAVDDIVRQFKGVSDSLMQKVVGSPSSTCEPASLVTIRTLSWKADDSKKLALSHNTTESSNSHNTTESVNSFSDNEEGDRDESHGQQEVEFAAQANRRHSDYELNLKGFRPRVVTCDDDVTLNSEEIRGQRVQSELHSRYPEASLALTSVPQEDPTGVPPEWTPPNLSVPVLNLVDKVFQLKRRGWLRRQAFWISKQILHLIMDDAIDDWLLRQIQWLRRDDVIAQGIRFIQDILWPNDTFFLSLNIRSGLNDCQENPGSLRPTRQQVGTRVSKQGTFEQQLEATRRASDVKKMLFNGAPTALVSLIGHKQYRRCARDIYNFLQSTICLKQLGYGILELLLISVFPELRDVVMDIHEKIRVQHV